MQEESLQAIRLIHSSMLAQKISLADFLFQKNFFHHVTMPQIGTGYTY